MSVDIAWDTITSGPDGDALSAQIRDFIHTKFQQITLPRFIKSVQVHSFEFGHTPPTIEIKDVCDPLPDFYEDSEDDEDEENDGDGDGDDAIHHMDNAANDQNHHRTSQASERHSSHRGSVVPPPRWGAESAPSRWNGFADRPSWNDNPGITFPRSSTPGIPGGTSNLSYFHLPVGGLSGTQTPLAAVASGTPFSSGPWHHEYTRPTPIMEGRASGDHEHRSRTDSLPSPEFGSPFDPSSPETRPVILPTTEKVSDELHLDDLSMSSALKDRLGDPSDIQVVARVMYDGDVRLTLTAEILLDYPMPSFVGIPLKISVSGMKFDGISIIAYIKKRMHFCFLDPEDAQTLVGDQVLDEMGPDAGSQKASRSTFGSLLREVQIESEIGRQGSGKQVLKNVSKVEKFVLEQVKKIFEEEFVFPSFWTFLV